MKRIYLVAGEESGDIHGANLLRAMRAQEPDTTFEGLGGRLMAEAGMTLHHDLAGEAIMGFTEVIRKFGAIRKLFLRTVEQLASSPPDALVLIDYPGFNIRLAKRAHALGIPVVFYISPQVWAWKKKRVHTLAKCVDKMLVIFPFEKPLYDAVGLDCAYVGHPLLDHIQRVAPAGETDGPPVIGILPGSREQEIQRLLEPMLQVAEGLRAALPDARFVTPAVNEARADQCRAIAQEFRGTGRTDPAASGDGGETTCGFPLEVEVGGMYDVLSAARFCLVTSGTATLETALFGVPMLIFYKATPVTYWMARCLVDIRHIGIVNILAGREIVPEFIQGDIVPGRILPKALALVRPSPERTQMLSDLREVRAKLGDGGASANAAREILSLINGATHA